MAYAPHETGKTLKNTSFIDFTVANQKDLLWANAKKQTIHTIAADGNNNKVKFHFAHALSRLGFTVKLKEEPSTDVHITLKSIKLAGSDDGTSKKAFYTGGDFDLAKGEWSQATLTTKENLNLFSGSKEVTSTSQSNIALGADYLFVIPQEFPNTTEDNKLYVIVEYDIKYDGITETITNTVHQKLTTDGFKQGKAYMINLTIGRPIEFDAEVKPWVDETNKNTDINIDSWE